MNLLLSSLFVVNIILVLVDASVAFHKAGRIVVLFCDDPDGSERGASRLRSLLPLLVAFYVTLDCYVYSLRHPGYLAGLGAVLIADVLFQFPPRPERGAMPVAVSAAMAWTTDRASSGILRSTTTSRGGVAMKPPLLALGLKGTDKPWVVDVRSGTEYRSGHIPGARHVPFWQIPIRLGDFPPNKQALVVLTCEHGPRAKIAQSLLSWAGYRNIELLDGHMAGWRRSGLPLER